MVTKRVVPQTNTADITTDGNGDGTVAITLRNSMNTLNYYADASIQEADITGNITIGSKTLNGFTIVLDGSAVTNGTVTVDWIAKQNLY